MSSSWKVHNRVGLAVVIVLLFLVWLQW